MVFLFILSATALMGCSNAQQDMEDALNGLDIPEETTDNIDWPSEVDDVELTYASDNEAVLSKEGVIERQTTDTDVTLTVTAGLDDETLSRDFTVTVVALEEQTVADMALDALAMPEDVSSDIDWPTLQDDRFADVSLSFVSDDPSLISDDGTIHRALEEKTASITVTATYEDSTASEVFDITLPARAMSDQEIVEETAGSLELPLDTVENDMDLPTEADEVSVLWSSSHPEYFTADGTVTRPFVNDAVVTLTATFTLNDAQTTRDYSITVEGLDESEITADLSDLEYTITQEKISEELNARITISGNAVIDPESSSRSIELVLYYMDDTIIETFDNAVDSESGDFEFTLNVNDYSIGWDWYKFALSINEDQLDKDFVKLPYTEDDQGEIAVLKGPDGDVRDFRMVSNEGYLNVSSHGLDDTDKTDYAKVLADYERLAIPDEILGGYELPQTTGEWGHDSQIEWASTDSDYAEVTSDREVIVHQSGAITLEATLTSGEESIVKSFTVDAVRGTVSFADQNASFETETDQDDNVDVLLNVTGTIAVEDLTERTYTLEAYITPGDDEDVLGSYSNQSTEPSSYEFSVPVSEFTFDGEWVKFRIVISENDETITYTFPDGSIELPETYQAGMDSGAIEYYYAGNQYDMFYVRTEQDFQTEDTTTDNTSLVMDNDRVYMIIEGHAYTVNGFDSTITLSISDVSETYDNTLDGSSNAYRFEVDLTDLEANGNWRDIHLNVQQTIGDTTYNHSGDFYAPWDVKDALNADYEIEHEGKTFSFAEWESDLKIVIDTP